MEIPNELAIEDLSPRELYWHVRNEFDLRSYAPQVQRDSLAKQALELYDEQCYAAIELGDERAFICYRRSARMILRIIDKSLHGAEFFLPRL